MYIITGLSPHSQGDECTTSWALIHCSTVDHLLESKSDPKNSLSNFASIQSYTNYNLHILIVIAFINFQIKKKEKNPVNFELLSSV